MHSPPATHGTFESLIRRVFDKNVTLQVVLVVESATTVRTNMTV